MMTESSEPVRGGAGADGTSAGTDAGSGAGGRRTAGAGGKRRGAAAASAAEQRARTPDDMRTPDAEPTEDEIRQRAYELYQARGDGAGDEMGDWTRAEREVRGRSSGDPALPSRRVVDESIGDM